ELLNKYEIFFLKNSKIFVRYFRKHSLIACPHLPPIATQGRDGTPVPSASTKGNVACSPGGCRHGVENLRLLRR
ncbi:MAG: hypothetical protein IJ160_00920, partial [Muribaculaceae bacterium]|nr:hypothetical protein [Muribaculaceae bacterium]